jgi:hypothetical protein
MTVKATVNLYRPLVYVIFILVIIFQFYVIWTDRIESVTYVKYSYETNGKRIIDSCIVDTDIKYISDLMNTEVLIAEKTNQNRIFIESWQRIYKDKRTQIGWENKGR